MHKKAFLSLMLSALTIFGGAQEITAAASVPEASDMFSDRDYEVGYDETESIFIQLEGSSASCSENQVEISGSTITITEEGTYVLSGTLDDGMILVDAKDSDKIQLVFDNVSIHSETSAPVYIKKADKVFITLPDGTTNSLSNEGTFEAIDDSNIDGCLFSREDLTLNGSGSLTITSPGGHGIVCKDDLVFTTGTYTIDCASHGLDANDSIRIANASLSIDSGKDGLHAENSDDETLGFIYILSGEFQISSQGDGMDASSCIQIEDGDFQITSGGGSENAEKKTSESWGKMRGGHMNPGFPQEDTGASQTDTSEESTSIKGIKSSGDLTINDGSFVMNCADDAIHSNASITVNGGSLEIAAGDDGFHADENLVVSSGTIEITESYEGLEGLHITISGGDIRLTASDDGLNAAGGTDESGFGGFRGGDKFGGGFGGGSSDGTIEISDGDIYIQAGGDGIDSNGSLSISGGNITVCGPCSGDTATLDYDTTGTITGGTFIGTGSSMMAQTFSDSDQGVVAVSISQQDAGTEITLTDSEGNTILSASPDLEYQVIILSSPDIVQGESYTLTVGSSSKEFTAS